MKEELITFETAKLAKEKGFNWECRMTAVEDTKHIYGTGHDNHNQYRNNVSIPTQSLLQRWLRDKCKIDLIIRKDWDGGVLMGYEYLAEENDGFSIGATFETYEEALENALQEALTLFNPLKDRTNKHN